MDKTKAETFNLSIFKHCSGPNPYLNTSALVFDLSILEKAKPLAIDEYCYELARSLPQLKSLKVLYYTELFTKVVVEVNKLEADLYLEKYSFGPHRIAIQSLHEKTSCTVVEVVWDWLETITRHEYFDINAAIGQLQEIFGTSVYGDPTVYSLIQAAYQRNIPTFYLPDERLMQYGYGKYQVRGTSTIFDRDSQLDSDFTIEKEDCKVFLAAHGFPVPQGNVVYTLDEAYGTIKKIGYPVAVKPVVGHEGIGATADVKNDTELEFAYSKATEALLEGKNEIIIEQSITGADCRLLCVGGKFVAGTERHPPYVVGDGTSTIKELIERENDTEVRKDTSTSPLCKIITDEIMNEYLQEQGLSVESVLEEDRTVYLRKVANISSGGVSIDITRIVHPDNVILAQDIAQYFHLVCLGVDVIAKDISQSWREGNFSIIEINAQPGVFMHLKPAIGESVDAPGEILDYLFPPPQPSRIPTITFNKLGREQIYQIIHHILLVHPKCIIGSICQEGIWLNHSQKSFNPDYNSNIKTLLRHPKLDLLIAEYTGDLFEQEGMIYEGSHLVILDEPTETEMLLARDLLPGGTLIIKRGQDISLQVKGLLEKHASTEVDFSSVYLKAIVRCI